MDSATIWTIGTVIFLIVVASVFLVLSVRVVKQHERAVVFRLGRTSPDLVRGPGLRFIIPVIDRLVRVDMREQIVEVVCRSSATQDRQLVDLDARVGYRVTDPLASVLTVSDLSGSLQARAVDALREIVGESSSEDVRFRREGLAADLRDRLVTETESWGVTITDVALS